MFHHRTRRIAAVVVGIAAVGTVTLVTPPTVVAADDVLTTIEVADATELAAAITAANVDLGPETIVLTADVTLTAPLPQVRGPVSIQGATADRAITLDTAGFRFVTAVGTDWDEPAGAAPEVRLGVGVRNLTITGGTTGGGSMMVLSRVHTTIEQVDFVDNTGGWEGNIYSKEAGSYLYVRDVDVTGQVGTLLTNDHGSTPQDSLDSGSLVLTDAAFDNRLYVEQSQFTGNSGCVIYTHRFTTISDSTFDDSGSVCLSGVSTQRLLRSTFTDTSLSFFNPWSGWTLYAQFDDVTAEPSIQINTAAGGQVHLVSRDTTLCGQPLESFGWSNPITTWTSLGDCVGSPPVWSDETLPSLAFGALVSDGVAATGDPAPTYAVSAGTLPAGLTLDAATGAVTGTTTVTGPYSFEITASNANGSVTATFTGTIAPPPVPSPLPATESLVVPEDGTPADGDGADDGAVQVTTGTGARLRLLEVAPDGDPRIAIDVDPHDTGELDRGVVATGDRLTVATHDVTFSAIEVCLPYELPASLSDVPADRIRLVHTVDGVERDITTRLVDGADPEVCGLATSGGTFQAIVLAADRIAGEDRYATAAALALELSDGPGGTVYLAGGEDHADATVAAVVAALRDAPLLLVRRDVLPDVVAAALTELAPSRIVVVGGPAAVSADVVRSLGGFAPVVDVVDGADRYATAAATALAEHPDGVDHVYLVAGTSFADAATGGTSAVRDGAALLLVPSDHLPVVVADALVTLDPARVSVVGGAAAISDVVLTAVGAVLPDATVQRVGGTDRYTTALELARDDPAGVLVAVSGASFADALVAIRVAERHDAALVLLPSGSAPASWSGRLGPLAPEHVVVVGGQRAVSPDSELLLARIQPERAPARL
jgi:putative cell wall-binding protein